MRDDLKLREYAASIGFQSQTRSGRDPARSGESLVFTRGRTHIWQVSKDWMVAEDDPKVGFINHRKFEDLRAALDDPRNDPRDPAAPPVILEKPLRLRATLRDARGIAIETFVDDPDDAIRRIARFVELHGTDPDEAGRGAAGGSVHFAPTREDPTEGP